MSRNCKLCKYVHYGELLNDDEVHALHNIMYEYNRRTVDQLHTPTCPTILFFVNPENELKKL